MRPPRRALADAFRLAPLLLLAACVPMERRRARGGALARLPPQFSTYAPLRIQIGVARRVEEAKVVPLGDYYFIDPILGNRNPLERGRTLEVHKKAGKVWIGPFGFSGQAHLIPAGPKETLSVDGRRYRGALVVKPHFSDEVTLVNEVEIEDYLCGVLPNEMSSQWPLEALKAQAVVARTFAMSHLGKFSDSGYDLSDDSASQVYTGIEGETPLIRQAVRDTSGQVLTYDGRTMKAFFHSCCGGRTNDLASVWGGLKRTPKPLQGVRDAYCKLSPQYRWTAYFSAQDILAAVQRHRFPGLRLNWVRLGEKDKAGYLKTLRLSVDRSQLIVRAADFRAWLGSTEFKSTQILRILSRKKGYEFTGKGYGHGVGLCQWGARVQAEKGRSYKTILAYYFPESRLSPRIQ